MALLAAPATEIVIPVCAVVGIVYSYSLVRWLLKSRDRGNLNEGEQGTIIEQSNLNARAEIKDAVNEGVKSFMFMEYRYVGVFMVASAILIFLFLGLVESFSTQSRPCTFDTSNRCRPKLATAVFSTVSFVLGAFTSILSSFLGVKIVVSANARTTLEVRNDVGRSVMAAFRSGAVMGFLLAAIGLLMLYLAINLFKLYYGNDWEGLFEAIAGYGLGGSSMALFGRAAGGIYAKATDVCIHLVEKIKPNIPQDRNPAVIPNYVGDIVGDIAGTGIDLFGSYAEASCAVLVVSSMSSFGIDHNFTAICYPLLISSMGILVCLITTLFAADFFRIEQVWEIKPALKNQLIISTILMTAGIAIVSWVALPSSFTVYNFESQKAVKNWQLSLCVGVGLWAGLIIEFAPKLYTNNASSPRQDVAANNVNYRVAFVGIPIFAAMCIFVSSSFAAIYGIAVAALGMLSTIATRLAIDAYGPIHENAKGVAEMAGVRALEDAGNTKVAIGKGFAIESTALMSFALFGAFVSSAAISPVDVLTPKVIIGLIVGVMLPNWFSAMTMTIVGSAGLKMVQEVLKQLEDNSELMDGFRNPDYATCNEILNDASIRGMIQPGALVMLSPLIVGTLFGVETLSGVLAGSLGSVVWIAISASNTGGAWYKAKEYIREGALEYATAHCPELCRYAESEEIIGDTRKDTSGPPLNILIQLMAVESLVFAPFFTTHGGLFFKIF